MLAVIKTGGKQYIVKPDDKIRIEKIEKKEGDEVSFAEVLLVEKNKKVEIGMPLVKGAKVLGKVLQQGREEKVSTVKFKSKVRYTVRKGHRQPFTEVKITKIETE